MRNKLAKAAVVLALTAGSVFAVASPASAAPTCQTLSDLANTYFQVRCKSWNTLTRYYAYGQCEYLGASLSVTGPRQSVGIANSWGSWSSFSCNITYKNYRTYILVGG
jgi:hypothetical protein